MLGQMSFLSKEIGQAIASLSHGLGIASYYLWVVTVRQEIVYGIEDMVSFLFALSIGITCLIYRDKIWKMFYNIEPLIFVFAAADILWMLLSLCFGIGHLINPGFYAVGDITNRITNIINPNSNN